MHFFGTHLVLFDCDWCVVPRFPFFLRGQVRLTFLSGQVRFIFFGGQVRLTFLGGNIRLMYLRGQVLFEFVVPSDETLQRRLGFILEWDSLT